MSAPFWGTCSCNVKLVTGSLFPTNFNSSWGKLGSIVLGWAGGSLKVVGLSTLKLTNELSL